MFTEIHDAILLVIAVVYTLVLMARLSLSVTVGPHPQGYFTVPILFVGLALTTAVLW